jgi:hypothetical protein
MHPAYILMIVAIAITIIVITVQYYRTKPDEQRFAPDLISLSIPTSIIPSDKATPICNSNDFTLSLYTFISAVNRTNNLSSAANTASLLGVNNMFSFNIGPSESALVLGSGNLQETLQLPIFPQQKWVYLTIMKTGRRFTVMYNDVVVGSKMVGQSIPVNVSNPLRIGNETIKGTYINGVLINIRHSPEEIAAIRAKTSDTRGNPARPLFASFIAFFRNKKVLCPPGVSCNEVLTNPTSLVSWDSPYA